MIMYKFQNKTAKEKCKLQILLKMKKIYRFHKPLKISNESTLKKHTKMIEDLTEKFEMMTVKVEASQRELNSLKVKFVYKSKVNKLPQLQTFTSV